METTSPVLAGRFFTTEPPGKLWEVGGGKHKGYIRVLGGREEEKVVEEEQRKVSV